MLIRRLRRLRQTQAVRELVCETHLTCSQLIYPLFVHEGETSSHSHLSGLTRYHPKDLFKHIELALNFGIGAIALFPVIDPSMKDWEGSEALRPDNLLNRTVGLIKREFPDLCIMTDVALDPYTTHGHDGIYDADMRDVLNDETVERLAVMALRQAEAGSDMVAPSDMMDGRVRAIRSLLDQEGFSHTLIHSYAAKYASSLYGPFRDCVGSKLKVADKKGYQLPPSNVREALLEGMADEEEGADILMIKPASLYLDVIHRLREATCIPVSAYQVSGEYAMIKAAALRGWVDERQVVFESLIAIKRAGANMILTYSALDVARWLTDS